MPLDPSAVSLAGKVAVVTGAARGIGESIALAFASFGADLAVCDREPTLDGVVSAVRELGRQCTAGVFDVREGERVGEFLDEVREAFGRVDVLVNNAAGTFRTPFVDLSETAQAALVAENFTSATHFLRGVVPLMPDGGSIINVTSVEAHRAGPGFSVYSAMKAALANLTKTLALELGDRGIRVNCIAPDVIATPGVGPIEADPPLGRVGHGDDVAGVAVFLASSLSEFVTGSTVHVDGGTFAAGGWHRLDGGGWEP